MIKKNSRYRNYTYLENNQESFIINATSSEKDHITQDIKCIQIQVKKTEFSSLRIGPKFIPATKGNALNSKSDILNLTRRLQLEEKRLEEILRGK